MKKLILFSFVITLLSLKPGFSQQAFRLTIEQPPIIVITIPEVINADIGKVVNLDTLFHVTGSISYTREWKFWNGSLMQAINNSVFEITSDGVLYLTLVDKNGCMVLDSIILKLTTGIEPINTGKDNRHSIDVYPNPNTGEFYITISDCRQGFSVEVINSLGVRLLDKILDCNNFTYYGTIIVPDRKSGTYYLLVKNSNKIIFRQKVIILN